MIKYKKINKCQISGNKNLDLILSLGLIPPVNQMSHIKVRPKEQFFFPKEILFPKEYPYTSSTTKILRENFTQLSDEVFSRFKISSNDLIIDIGSNDGNLLSNFKNKMRVLGITPENVGKTAISKGIPTILEYFTNNLSLKIKKKYGKAKIITATNVFAHIDNPNLVLKSIKSLLSDDGIFISESHYLPTLIEDIQYDTIYHEHLRYYSLNSLNYLFAKHGLQIIYARKINTHGGSIRVYATKKNKYKIDKAYKKLIQYENKYIFPKALYEFKFKVIESKLKLYQLLSKIKNNKNKIYGISAPSRSTTLINYLGINSDILECILEIKGSKKINHYLPGTDIPIYDEEKLYKDQPEYAFVLSWHIGDEIINNLRKKGFKGRFIVPLPEPKLIA